MSELSIRELKEKLEKIEARNEKLNQEAESVREVIEKKDDAFKPLREQHLEVGVTKILEELGWTKTEYIKALGGSVDESKHLKATTAGSGSPRNYLIKLNLRLNVVMAIELKLRRWD